MGEKGGATRWPARFERARNGDDTRRFERNNRRQNNHEEERRWGFKKSRARRELIGALHRHRAMAIRDANTRFLEMSGGLQVSLRLSERRATVGIVVAGGHSATTSPGGDTTNAAFTLPERTRARAERQQHDGENCQVRKRAGYKARQMRGHEWEFYQKRQLLSLFLPTTRQ